MVWTKSYKRIRDVYGSVIANVRVIVDYNGTNNRIAALLEVKDYSTTGVDITIDPSDATATTWQEGTDFTAETSKAVTAENIATAINTTTNYTASADTGHEGNPWVSIVYTAGGYLSSISTTNTAVYKFYSEAEATTGVPKLAQDDSGTIKHQPLWTDSNGQYSFYIDAPTDIDLNYQKSGYNFDNTYSEDIDITVGTTTALSDSDKDTIIKTEETADEDKVRIDTGGTERMVIDSTGIDAKGNSLKNVSTLETDTIILSGEYGVQWDQSSSSPDLTRLGSAEGLSAGSAFNSLYPWGGMQRVNLADDGTVNALYGDGGYIEDGSNGQVMVRIPKFWYKTEKNGSTYQFWISPRPKPDYKIHPTFIRGGKIKDYVYVGAYEATVYDDSVGSYVGDGITYDYANDIMASVADLQPISGNSDNLDILEARQLAGNRGAGWAQCNFFNMTAWQLLAVVEYASFAFQTNLSTGITNLDSGSGNHSQNTGHTSSFGNASGEVVISTLENGATGDTETYACSYRGIENPYGNIWSFTDGIFVKDDGYYIESDPANWNSDGTGYTHISATPINSDGYIDDIDYLTELDYQFFAGSAAGSSSTYLCDKQWSHDSGEVNILLLGGCWVDGSDAGLFYSRLNRVVAYSRRSVGSRLEFVG